MEGFGEQQVQDGTREMVSMQLTDTDRRQKLLSK